MDMALTKVEQFDSEDAVERTRKAVHNAKSRYVTAKSFGTPEMIEAERKAYNERVAIYVARLRIHAEIMTETIIPASG